METFCTACKGICGNPISNFDGIRCLWCQRTAHNACLEKIPEECDYGEFASMIMKPPEIVYEKNSINMARKLHSVVKGSIERVKRFRKKNNGKSNFELL